MSSIVEIRKHKGIHYDILETYSFEKFTDAYNFVQNFNQFGDTRLYAAGPYESNEK
ncbi:hypothetical protein [Caulobacter phage Cr30]|uniref:hypothetical protein n=1 Tax=Caulobacter phage Cr30 TaxID=1357714 RepID=UPI0004A9BB56|nr:hypothetical protein OZ74_gp027 [Caulobacter phage Cr30]AGS80912.1 hypothetical protein [Caulobacter phage Cr30]